MDEAIYDFIVVGAGSAGCVVAGNLNAEGHTVLLLEAGPDCNDFWIKAPLGYGRSMFNRNVNWMYYSEPEPALQGRRVFVPRGKLVGGSSAINAMVYMRGTPADFSDWAAAGNPEWAWPHVLESYKRMENYCVRDPEWHGLHGPLQVSNRSSEAADVCRYFFEACESLQHRRCDDFNGASNEGVGYYHHTIAEGERMSAARAWLAPARQRFGFHLASGAFVRRLNYSGNRVCGVSYSRDGVIYDARANHDVIVSAGAINSPQLLSVSGIGPDAELQRLGIEVKHHSPAVGRYLQDHFSYDHYYRSRVATWNQTLHGWPNLIKAGIRYILSRSGPLTTGTTHAGGYLRSSADRKHPNLQLYFSPITRDAEPGGEGKIPRADSYPAFSMGVCNTRPRSTGRITLSSAELKDAPRIEFNFLDDEDDLQEMLEGVDWLRRLARAPALAEIIEREYLPGPSVETREQFEEDIRARGYSIYHPCGTCRMGSDPRHSVVDSRLRVHGVSGLRVADASVFPNIVSGNLNGPSMMVGQRASELILEDLGKAR